MRTAVITGATSGLGRATAELIARTPGWRVVLAVRDPRRGAELAGRLGAHTGVVTLDLASLASVRSAAGQLVAERTPISALVLNAGLQLLRTDRSSADGYEMTFAVNHLGHFALASLLRPHLATGARIAVVSSGTHWGTLAKSGPFPAPRWADPHELARPRPGSGLRAYATSKLANLYFTYEAARRWPDVAVDAYDPGLMPATGLGRAHAAPVRAAYGALAPLLTRLPFAQRPEEGGAQLARVVTEPAVVGRTGRYLELGRPAQSSPESYDVDRADRLWRVSEALSAPVLGRLGRALRPH